MQSQYEDNIIELKKEQGMTDFEQGPSERAPISSADIEGIDQTAEGLGLNSAAIFKRAMGEDPFELLPPKDDKPEQSTY